MGQTINLPNGKYVTLTSVNSDGTISAFETNLVTSDIGEPTSVKLTPALTRALLFSLLGIQDPGNP